MNKLQTPIEVVKVKKIALVAFSLSLLTLLLLIILFLTKTNRVSGRDIKEVAGIKGVLSDGMLTVGYGGFPPYTQNDLKEPDPNDRIKGYSIDLVNEIAKLADPQLKVQWVNFNWETLKTDMLAGKFEFVADPVYQTITRAEDLGVSDPYAYFGIAVGVVQINDNRFTSFKDLDRSDITISLAEGWTSTEYAKKNLTKPKFKLISVTGEAYNQMDEVLFGRADVALNDVPTVIQYVNAHRDKVKAIFLDNPPSIVPGGFIAPKENLELLNFLNASIRILQADGTLKKLDDKWKTYGYIPQTTTIPGQGLQK